MGGNRVSLALLLDLLFFTWQYSMCIGPKALRTTLEPNDGETQLAVGEPVPV